MKPQASRSWSLCDYAVPVFWNCTRVVTPRHSASRRAQHPLDLCTTTTTTKGPPLNNGDDNRHGYQNAQTTPAPLFPRSHSAEVLLVSERQFWSVLWCPSSLAVIAAIFVQMIWDFYRMHAVYYALLESTDINLATRKSLPTLPRTSDVH